MIAPETITGTVESNNGAEALVSFADGAQLFHRGRAESETEFLANFPVGGPAEAKRLACDISTREGIFDALENIFGDTGLALNISDLAVFCAPVCESPDGSNGHYFALCRGEQWEWLEVSHENFKYVCVEIGKTAANDRRWGWGGRRLFRTFDIQQILRHSSVDVTRECYIKSVSATAKTNLDKIDVATTVASGVSESRNADR